MFSTTASASRVLDPPSSGRRCSLRDTKLLTDAETALIDRYRTMDVAGHAMLRTLIERLHATRENDADDQ